MVSLSMVSDYLKRYDKLTKIIITKSIYVLGNTHYRKVKVKTKLHRTFFSLK